ncbi:MAG: sulfatase-like hydrolase/transferase, partial [bacterium]|nr:sulfatase-like hydrolase/transferase [bacterium]
MNELDGAGVHATHERWKWVDSTILLALVLVFLASRLFWLGAYPGSSQYWEEAYRWVAIEEIMSGAQLPLADFQADHYQGGSLVVIGLAVSLCWIGLASAAALKIAALTFSSATLIALFGIGRVFFGRTSGVFCGVIYLLGPPLVAFWGVVAMGFHSESVLLSLVAVGIFLALSTRRWHGPLAWLSFGLVSGLSVWFTPTAAIAIAACLLSWLLLADWPRIREVAIAAVGLVFGLLPWLFYNVTHEFAGVVRLFEVFGIRESTDPWGSQGLLARMGDLLLRVPSQGLLDPSGEGLGSAWVVALTAGVWIPAGVALACSFRRSTEALRGRVADGNRGGRLELVFSVYAVLFIVIYLFSRFTFDPDPSPVAFRLMVPLAVFLIVPISVSSRNAWQSRVGRAAAVLGLACLAGSTAGFAMHHVEPGTPLTLQDGDRVWGRLLHRKYPAQVERAVAVSRLIPEERRKIMLAGIGWGIEEAYGNSGELADVDETLARIEGHDRIAVEQGMRRMLNISRKALRASLARNDDPDKRRTLRRLEDLAAWTAPAVVLITLDTTRVDHLSCYGYERKTTPNLDALAERSVRYRRAWSTSSWTLPAHASLFTGMYPSRHGAHYEPAGEAVLGDVLRFPGARHVRAGMLAAEATTLAEILARAGFATGAFVAGPWLHREFGLLQGFRHKDDSVTSFGGRPASEISAAAIAWLDNIPPDRPFFLFANYFDPHAPYARSEAYPDLPRAAEDLDFDYGAVMRGETPLSAEKRAVLRDRYDGEIRDMDRALGTLFDAIAARRNGSRTLIVVTADHGEALGDGGRIGHGFWLTEELTRVPLVVRYPQARDGGTWREEPIQLVDILPLVAAELGLRSPAEVEGVPVGSREAAFAELYREASTAKRFGQQYDRDLEAVIRWPYKLVRTD